jgi:hypothetical protein
MVTMVTITIKKTSRTFTFITFSPLFTKFPSELTCAGLPGRDAAGSDHKITVVDLSLNIWFSLLLSTGALNSLGEAIYES